MASSVDLSTWTRPQEDTSALRIHALTVAPPGWFGAYFWVDEATDTVEVSFEPVIAWASMRWERGDDEIVAILRYEDKYLGRHNDDVSAGVDALITDAERSDEALLARLKSEARKRHEDERRERARAHAQHEEIMQFVRSQPNPARFAASMRTGAKSPEHAWLAITLAEGDAEKAIALSQQRYMTLLDLQRKRQGVTR